MCLLLGGCSADRESSTSLEGGPPRQEEVSREKPEFVKVKYAYFEDPEDPQRYYEGFYALDSAGELFLYDRDQDILQSIATGIQDFTSGKSPITMPWALPKPETTGPMNLKAICLRLTGR